MQAAKQTRDITAGIFVLGTVSFHAESNINREALEHVLPLLIAFPFTAGCLNGALNPGPRRLRSTLRASATLKLSSSP